LNKSRENFHKEGLDMSGEDVARARIALDEEIDRADVLVKRLQFQETSWV